MVLNFFSGFTCSHKLSNFTPVSKPMSKTKKYDTFKALKTIGVTNQQSNQYQIAGNPTC